MRRQPSQLHARGFTLVEAIVVIIITGIVASVVAKFIVLPVQGYADLARRAELTDIADTALRRMARDLRLAVPNSVRPTGATQQLEFLRTSMGGRYRAAVTSTGSGNILDFNSASDSSFEILGPALTFSATTTENQNEIVIYNLGIPGADAYQGDNRRKFNGTPGSVSTVSLTPATAFPFDSPAHRFQVIDTPVEYVCDTTAGTLTRYWGYAIASAQTAPPAAPYKSALLATNVVDCRFNYSQLTERNGLVTLRLSIGKGGETVTLYHEVHVNNVP